MALDLNRGETAGSTSKGSDLDRYGVWVKKPPRTVEDTAAPTEEDFHGPSPIDDLESAAREETSGIDALMDTGIAVPPAATDGEDALPPETFIDADFLDDFTNDISTLDEIQEEEPVQAAVQSVPASQEGEIAVEELLDGSDEVPLEDFMVAGPQEGNDILDESPMDMDLTFDDEFALEEEAAGQAGGEKTGEIQGTHLDSLQVSDYTGASLESDDDFDAEKIISEAEDIGGDAAGGEPRMAHGAVQGHSDSDDARTEKSQDDMTERPEEAMEFNQDGMEHPAGSRTEELINNIASEIALLRDEIANLKADFEAFKGGKVTAAPAVAPEVQQEGSGGGFFADTEDDDTIALSGDELSNILNTADFTEESVDAEDGEPDNGLPAMDFDSETLEEPVIEASPLGEEPGDDLPEEIDVPTGAAGQQEGIFEEVEPTESTEGLYDEMFEGFDFEDEPAMEEDAQAQELSSDDGAMDLPAGSDDEPEPESPVEPEALDEPAEPFEEELTDEPTEAVFESSQWDDSTSLVDSAEKPADTVDFDNDSLVIEEAVDTVSDAEEELLETLAAGDEVGAETEEFQAEEADFVEPVVEDLPALEPEPALEADADETETADGPAETFGEEAADEPTEGTEELYDEMFEGFDFEDEPAMEEDVQAQEPSSDDGAMDLPAGSDDEPEPDSPVEPEALDEPAATDVPEAAGAIAGDGPETAGGISDSLKNDIKAVLVYMDQLLDSLPEEKIAEFARSEHFELYKRLFTELGLS